MSVTTGDLGKIVYLTAAQKNTLFANGSVTVDGTTITYNANDIYLTPEDGTSWQEPVASTSVSSSGLISYKNANGTTLFTVQLPLYNGGVS